MKSIECWRRQTYPNRQLLILADGEDVQDAVPNEPEIHYRYLGPGQMPVGAKRNFGCSIAAGDLVAHWDDDDYSAPARLADQVERLRQTGKSVTGYHSMRFFSGSEWWEYRGMLGYALGTSLCYRRDWWQEHQFPDNLNVGEDNQFVFQARSRNALVSVAAGEMMIATIHVDNTSPRGLRGRQWTRLK